MQARLRGLNNLLISSQNYCSEDEIAESRPDMNIKVTAFTKSKKISYISHVRKVTI